MTAFLRLLSDVVYPPLCPATGAETGVAGALSPEAWGDLSLLLSGPRCGRCGRQMPGVSAPDDALVCEVCQDRPRGWDRGAAAFRYEGTGRRLVMALKHGDRLDLVPMLAGWMLRAGGPLLERADLVVPVPMHWTRLLRRRHNQSAELARALCRLAGRRTAYAPHLLTRARATPAQKGRSLDQRTANLTGAIALTGAGSARVAGRRILLVDDVMTTGATLEACAASLRHGGAARIDVLVAALVNFTPAAYVGDESGVEGAFA